MKKSAVFVFSLIIVLTSFSAIHAAEVTGLSGNTKAQFTLHVAVTGSGTTNPEAGDHVYDEGASVWLSASAESGWRFDHWEGDATGTASVVNFSMDQDKNITAVFVECGFTLTTEVQGNGTTNPAVGTHPYTEGQIVEVTATPEAGWVFDHWEGDLSGVQPSGLVYIGCDAHVTAVFVEGDFTLAINVSGSGTTNPAPGIWTYSDGQTVSISATPNSGWVFDHWDGDLSGTAASQSILMNADKTVTAVFVTTQTYNLVTSVTGQGTISPAAGSHVYAQGAVVNITATPSSNWAFDHWEGDLTGTNPFSRVVVMSANKSVMAVFSPQAHTLSIEINGQGQTTPSAGDFPTLNNRSVEIYAYSTVAGSIFHHWEGDLSGTENPTSIFMDADHSVIAVFLTSYSLTTAVQGNGSLDPPAGFRWLGAGSEVTLTATPSEGWVFDHWEGGLTGSENPAVFEINENKNITAVFTEAVEVYLTALTYGAGSVNPAGTTSYMQGAEVTLTATPEDGWRFSGWQGDLTGAENPASFVINSDKTVTAVFSQLQQYSLTTEVEGEGSVTPEGTTFHLDGSEVTLTATPGEGWEFVEWQGALTGSENPAMIIMDDQKSVTAVFSRIPVYYTLTVAVTGEGTTEPAAGEHSVLESTLTDLTATPAEGWRFDRWEGDLTGNTNPTQILMNAGKSITAVFVPAASDFHTADQNQDHVISLTELLRVIQFFNTGGYHCAAGTEDGYAPGIGEQDCTAHASDYYPQNWQISLTELLRLIQFFNTGGYHTCETGEDGFCPGPAAEGEI